MPFTPRRILAYAPHTDDVELGCGGTLSRFVEEGAEVRICAFSACEEWVPEPFPKDVLLTETRRAAAILGIPEERVETHRFRATELWRHRDEIFDIMQRHRTLWDPDLVFAPCPQDMHQDHAAIAAEVCRNYKGGTVWGYESPLNLKTFSKDVYVLLEERHLQRKLSALDQYDSQKGKNYFSLDFLRGQMHVRGHEVRAGLAECFQLFRMTI